MPPGLNPAPSHAARIRERVVAGVRERHVADAKLVELAESTNGSRDLVRAKKGKSVTAATEMKGQGIAGEETTRTPRYQASSRSCRRGWPS